MARSLRTTLEPDIVALTIKALRIFSTHANLSNDFERDMTQSFIDLDISREVATRLVANFDTIKPAVRMRILGPLGASDTQIPAGITKGSRTPNALAARSVLRPGLVNELGAQFMFETGAQTHNGILGSAHAIIPQPHALQPLEEQILAPERFTITYQGMHCRDETGLDSVGSDEIYILTSAVHITTDGTNIVRTERHPLTANGSGVYGDVDSDETRIGPVAACWAADVSDFQAGMSLTTVFMEHDQGDPDAYRDEVDAAVKLSIAAATYFFPPGGVLLALIEASGLVTDFFNWLLGTGDDEIGTASVVLGTLSELEDFARTGLGHLFVRRDGKQVDTGLANHFTAAVSGNDYLAAYRVVRQPTAPLKQRIID
ncbi:uncharacterized protein Dvar_36260 [Desulfosarcina variabilis str. Montpellier]|uniref:hypothetical protein n=1 Tax=Desulfosarcina variabilis TaxID=2300 RepID=UPI003AFA1250